FQGRDWRLLPAYRERGAMPPGSPRYVPEKWRALADTAKPATCAHLAAPFAPSARRTSESPPHTAHSWTFAEGLQAPSRRTSESPPHTAHSWTFAESVVANR